MLDRIERATMPLWPMAGKILGLGKSATYDAAIAGEFPGAFKVGGKWLVSRQALDSFLATGGKA